MPLSDIHCRLLFADDVTIDQSWRVPLSNPFWRLYWNSAEGAAITWPSGVMRLPAERLVLVPAWGRFNGTCSVPVRHRFVHVDPMGLSSGWVREHCPRPFLVPQDDRRERVFEELFTHSQRDAVWRLRLQGLVVECLAELLAWLPPGAVERLGSGMVTGDPVAPALRLIEENLRDSLSTEALALRCALSTDHFAKVFQAQVGQTPARYVQERRVVVAAERLLASDEDIGGIASECGFSNRFHFTRVFTRRMGTPPALYRKGGRW